MERRGLKTSRKILELPNRKAVGSMAKLPFRHLYRATNGVTGNSSVVESKDRNATVSYYAGLELRAPSAEDLKHGPANPIAAIEGLHVHHGFACRRCEFVIPSWKWLREHWNKEHKEQRIGGRSRTSVRIQTFFTGPKSAIHYFCVTAAGADEKRQFLGTAEKKEIKARAERQLVADIKGQWAYTQGQQEEMQKVLADGILRHETTNWLKRSSWLAHFHRRDLGKIYACSRMPGRDDDELWRLTAAMDHLFFSRCIEGLKSMPLITQLLLASPHHKDAHSRPFRLLQEKTNIDRYLVYCKQFLYYCLNVLHLDEPTLLKEHSFRFTDEQRIGLKRVWGYLVDDGRSDDEALEEEILQVLARFWMQRLDGDPFDSPLWHFVGVLGIDGESGQLQLAHLFTYMLAGLAIPTRERPGIVGLAERFAQVRNDWLCKATYSPMGYTLSLLLYSRKIAQETGSRLMVSWSKHGELIYFIGKPILIEDICSIIAEMITNAEDLLWGSLMFKEGADARFAIPLATIEDNLTYTIRGQSFIHSNGLGGKEVVMLEDLIARRRKQTYLDKQGQWKWAGIRKYLKLVKKFEELLLILMHFTGGQPSWGEEITGLHLVNAINRDCNIFVINGEVILITQYHKSLAHFDSPKVMLHFLTARALCNKICPPSDFVWHSENGPWESSQMSAAIASKKHARQRGAAKADFEDADNNDDAKRYKVPDDLAAAYTSQTAANYGVTIDHTFLGCTGQPPSGPSLKRKGAAADAKGQEARVALPKRAKTMPLEKLAGAGAGESGEDQLILRALQTILRNDHAQFQSPQQEEAMQLAAAKETPLITILPTGGSKSLVFMVPAMLTGAGVTIVVAPYAELKRQLVTRCIDAGLDCKDWPKARDSWPRITIVSAEAAGTDDFLQWAADLAVWGRLDRVVIDECHLTFTAANEYRGKLQALVRLRNLCCPFVFLTGTLPPLCKPAFEEAMQLRNPIYIRTSSYRIQVRYSVLRVQNGRGIMKVKALVNAQLGGLSPEEKGVIYCISHAKCRALAQQLRYHYYYGRPEEYGSDFAAQREAGFQAWLCSETPYIVATAALGTGLDVAGIIHVIHLEAPASIIDYAQEAGRAGRAGERVTAQIVVKEKDWPAEDAEKDSCLDLKRREVNSLVRTHGCQRRVLGQCLDRDPRDCKGIDSDALYLDRYSAKGTLAATADPSLWAQVQELAGRKHKYIKLIYRQEMINAIAIFDLILKWHKD
ncbi:recQ family helicase [Dactylonectria estremocensis]|uniref:DNA 3'-5' helicase n=1 Tax=Dactylonectria estremocensis TaxID=1079267 RepID=A0A9P9D0I7_9HYPO|nr:recQ family helicase [Dactylonectria estremocensis]